MVIVRVIFIVIVVVIFIVIVISHKSQFTSYKSWSQDMITRHGHKALVQAIASRYWHKSWS